MLPAEQRRADDCRTHSQRLRPGRRRPAGHRARDRARTRSPRRCTTCCPTDPSPSRCRSPPGGPIAALSGSQALLELTDYAPLPLREPVRSLVWVRGRLSRCRPPRWHAMLDLIAAEHPNPALLQVETPRSAPVRRRRHPVHAAAARDRLRGRDRRHRRRGRQRGGPARGSARPVLRNRVKPCSGTWTPPITTWSHAWYRGCRRRCGAGRSARSGWTGTACGSASKATTATTTSGCPSTSRWTTCTGLSQAIRVLMGCPFINGLRARR